MDSVKLPDVCQFFAEHRWCLRTEAGRLSRCFQHNLVVLPCFFQRYLLLQQVGVCDVNGPTVRL